MFFLGYFCVRAKASEHNDGFAEKFRVVSVHSALNLGGAAR
jgi:hypothetical protein